MKLSDFRYPLPRNLIAKYPAQPRDSARLMVINRADASAPQKKNGAGKKAPAAKKKAAKKKTAAKRGR